VRCSQRDGGVQAVGLIASFASKKRGYSALRLGDVAAAEIFSFLLRVQGVSELHVGAPRPYSMEEPNAPVWLCGRCPRFATSSEDRFAGDDRRTVTAWHLCGNIWHQGSVYQTTAHAVPFLIELAAHPLVPDRRAQVG
jgi:hypothetical protein